jgi:hypothetical protein
MKQVHLGHIKIDNIDGEFIRLTVDCEPFLDKRLEQMEAEGETLAEALMLLHEQVENVLAGDTNTQQGLKSRIWRS